MKRLIIQLLFCTALTLPSILLAQSAKKMDCSQTSTGNYIGPTLMVANNTNSTIATSASLGQQSSSDEMVNNVLTALSQNRQQSFSFPKLNNKSFSKSLKRTEKPKGVSDLIAKEGYWEVQFEEKISEQELKIFFISIGY